MKWFKDLFEIKSSTKQNMVNAEKFRIHFEEGYGKGFHEGRVEGITKRVNMTKDEDEKRLRELVRDEVARGFALVNDGVTEMFGNKTFEDNHDYLFASHPRALEPLTQREKYMTYMMRAEQGITDEVEIDPEVDEYCLLMENTGRWTRNQARARIGLKPYVTNHKEEGIRFY